jgi:N-ethylmaleimide reductase
MIDLFSSFDLNGLILPNRMALSPMTRTRASEDDVPTELMRDYYVQRSTAGLLITECTQVPDQAHGIIRAPGLHRPDQIAGWRMVTDAVHAACDCRHPAHSTGCTTAIPSRPSAMS